MLRLLTQRAAGPASAGARGLGTAKGLLGRASNEGDPGWRPRGSRAGALTNNNTHRAPLGPAVARAARSAAPAAAPKMVTLNVDGKPVTVPAGSTILQARGRPPARRGALAAA